MCPKSLRHPQDGLVLRRELVVCRCSVRSAISMVWTRLAGSMTTNCARAGAATRRSDRTSARKVVDMTCLLLSACEPSSALDAAYAGNSRSLVRYTFTRCPSRIVMVGSRLRNRFITCARRLRGRIADAAGDDDRAIAVAVPEARSAEGLGQAADQTDRRRGAERRQVVLVHLVAQAGIADLIECRGTDRGGTCGRPASAGDGRPRPAASRRTPARASSRRAPARRRESATCWPLCE